MKRIRVSLVVVINGLLSAVGAGETLLSNGALNRV